MKACFRPKAKWCCEKNADGGSSVEYGVSSFSVQ